jgi:hypothetical protein
VRDVIEFLVACLVLLLIAVVGAVGNLSPWSFLAGALVALACVLFFS